MSPQTDLAAQLATARAECASLAEENRRLRQRHGEGEAPAQAVQHDAKLAVTHHSAPAEKVALFRALFRGREDVFAVRWENHGKVGYSPACIRDWNVRDADGKPKRTLIPLTDDAIFDHLAGRHVAGVYPLQHDETCWFLAADFDKAAWQDDAAAFLAACDEWSVPAALERSRSGKGAHVWMFFAEPVAASIARKLGSALLTRAMERRHQLGLDSYDRLFPNQDTMPKGGFGNLIALPLQHAAREQGNSVFVDAAFAPHADQWAFLSSVKRTPPAQLESLVREAERTGRVIGLRLPLDDDDAAEPWKLAPSRTRKEPPITEPLPASVGVVRANLVFIEKTGLPSAMLNRLLRLAAFQNPEFYRAQAMRLSTFGKPRVIRCGEEFPLHIALPRGCLDDVLSLLKAHRITAKVRDERFAGTPISAAFRGELRPEQLRAADALLAHDDGVLSATTAFGKTVVAAHIIAGRGVNTLVLVHRRQLMDQWRERLATFLDLPPTDIGQIGGGKTKRTGIVDVAVIQSLVRKGAVKDFVAEYGHVVVDECHHLSAFSFEQVMRAAKARHILGLTATPFRKDGHHPIIFMQCGPVRHVVDARVQAAARPFRHIVLPRATTFHAPPDAVEIHQFYAALAADPRRNDFIIADVLAAVREGRSPLVLTERTAHLDELAARLHCEVPHIITLRGGMGEKQRRALADTLAAIPADASRVLLATGRYIGEGFDDARLDTLFLAMPVSWRGTLAQYAGRLHRLHDSKREVRILDYVDGAVPLFNAMFDKRRKGYAAIGYDVVIDEAQTCPTAAARG